jgi:hypothetical protein
MLRIIIITCLTTLLSGIANTQITIGLNTSIMPHRNVNRIIKDYNSSRPWLDKNMGSLNLMSGFHIGYMFGDEDFRYSFAKITWYRAQSTAYGTPPNQSQTEYRDLRLRQLDIDLFEAAAFFDVSDNHRIGAGIGFNVGYTKFKTRTYNQNLRDDKEALKELEYTTIYSSASEFLNISTNFGISPRLYYVPAYNDVARIEFGIGPNLIYVE